MWTRSLRTLVLVAACLANRPLTLHAAGDPETERILAALEAARRSLSLGGLELDGILARTGREPSSIVTWVRANVVWVPYLGLLRGASGAMLDRMGNSIDRSLLLAELLRSAGFSVRLARGKLGEDATRELLSRVWPPPRWPEAPIESREPDPPAMAAAVRGQAEAVGLDPTRYEAEFGRLGERAVQREQEARRRVEVLTAALLAALPERGTVQTVDAAALEALRDHWWVELSRGGEWEALDLLQPEGAASGALAEATERFPWDRPDSRLPDVPDLHHEVQVRVVVEKLTNGRVEEQVALEHVLRPVDVLGRQVSLLHLPVMPSRPEPASAATGDEPSWREALALHEWLPALFIEGSPTLEKSFNDAGDINERPQDVAAGKLASAAARQGGDAGAALGGEDAAPLPATSYLTAEWLELEIRAPGAPPRRSRSAIFDLLGPAARTKPPADFTLPERAARDRALRLAGEVEILLTHCDVPRAYFESLLATRVLADAPLLFPELVSADASRHLDPGGAGRIRQYPGPLYNVALSRFRRGDGARKLFHASPNAFVCHLWPRPAEGEELSTVEALDLLDVRLEPIAAAGASPFVRRVEQGVADGVAESLAFSAPAPGGTTVDVFLAATGKGRPIVLRTREELAARGLRLAPDLLARLEASLAAGRTLILPPAPAMTPDGERWAWWEVSPDGTTAAVVEDGRRGALSDKEIIDRCMPYLSGLKRAEVLRRHVAYTRSREIQAFIGVVIGWAAVLGRHYADRQVGRRRR